jgi:SAM-dependent methyltransferase
MLVLSQARGRQPMSTSAELDASYIDHVAKLERRSTSDDALRRAVGGEFIAIGQLEYQLLRSRGLRSGQLVVDVGCGSGRLACQLAPFPDIRYIGTDVVPRLLDYASGLCSRPDWTFLRTDGARIPCDDEIADFVCFFSVFTHLHQEDIYRYLREAHRVLKPGGLVLMSFLEFRVPSHWATFIASVDGTREDQHLNQFIERDSIHAWAGPAGFDVRTIHGGDTEYIPLPSEVRYENGSVARGAASLGQSLAVLQKRRAEPEATGPTPAAPADAASILSARPADARPVLQNTSAKLSLAAGGSATVGFILGSPSRVLVRAVGPTLSMVGVTGPVQHPMLELFSGDKSVTTAGAWMGRADVAAAAAKVGAFPLAPDSADAALLLELAAGSHSVRVKSSAPGDSGEVLVEIYAV